MRNFFLPMLLAACIPAAVQADPLPATAQAAQAGIKTCLPAIEKLEAFLSRDQSANALAFWDSAAPDANLFSVLLALENKTGNTLANLNVAPSSAGQCVVEYTQTGYVPQTCSEHFRSLGNAARFVRDLNSKTAMLQGQGVQIYLTPAGQGCLWMRKEIIKQPGLSRQGEAASSNRPATAAKTKP